MKVTALMILILMLVGLAGCKKPAYSDMKVDEKGREAKQDNEPTSNPSATSAAETPTNPSPTPSADPSAPLTPTVPAPIESAQAPTPVPMPSFFDTTKGQIKDLPTYPESVVRNMQVGPLNGVASTLILLDARGPMEKIAKFYDAAVKSKGWTVVVRIDDPEIYKLELKKGDLNEALVQVNQDKQSGRITIMLSRAEQPPPAKP